MHIRKQSDCYFLRAKETQTFWNLVWYFTQLQLPYEFLVPYDDCYNLGCQLKAEMKDRSPLDKKAPKVRKGGETKEKTKKAESVKRPRLNSM